jgi:hypothetical protein
MDGELIAVSFAGPADPTADKFGYHVHLDELKSFLWNRPAQPLLYVPDPWPTAYASGLTDVDQDGVVDLLVAGEGEELAGLLFDLDQDSAGKFSAAELEDAFARQAWDFEFAFHPLPTPRSFWDCDNDGQIDLILIDGDEDKQSRADHVRRLVQGKWTHEPPRGQSLFDPSAIQNERLRQRLAKLLESVTSAGK